MPNATVDSTTKREELVCIEGAFVTLRKLTYGEVLESRDLGMQFGQGQNNNDGVAMKINSRARQVYEFSRAVVDHNLEDNGRKLDMSKEADILSLDPVVAQEIEGFIDSMNNLTKEGSKSVRA